MIIRSYVNGPFRITRAETGLRHGLMWVLYRDEAEVCDSHTLKAAKRAAAGLGAIGDWMVSA